jgi:hypothetical protein
MMLRLPTDEREKISSTNRLHNRRSRGRGCLRARGRVRLLFPNLDGILAACLVPGSASPFR